MLFRVNNKDYYVIRTQKKYANRNEKSFRKEHPEGVELIYKNMLPSSAQFFDSFRKAYRKRLNINMNNMKMPEDMTQLDLLLLLNQFHEQSLRKFIASRNPENN